MKVLLISNSYFESTIINILQYLFPFDISHIILLEENHSKEDIIKSHHKIIIASNLLEAVKKCDIVLLFRHSLMSEYLDEKLRSICECFDKEILSYSVPCFENHSDMSISNADINCSDKPFIMILSLGLFNQNIYLELLVNKIFNDMEINTIQIFSRESENIIKQINPKQIVVQDKQGDVIVQNIVFNDIENILQNNELLDFFQKFKPDFIIINLESGMSEKCDINKMIERFGYRYNTNVDMVVISNYCSIMDKKNTYMPLYNNENNNSLFISTENLELENVIKQKIMDKLSYPNGIIIKR